MKKYALLIAVLIIGCVNPTQNTTKPMTIQKQATLADFDNCADSYESAKSKDFTFPSTKQALQFFPKLLDKDNTPVPKYRDVDFNMACGGTASTGVINTSQKQGKTWVEVKTCGESDVCTVAKGFYANGLKGNNETIILKYGYIFYVHNEGFVNAYKLSEF